MVAYDESIDCVKKFNHHFDSLVTARKDTWKVGHEHWSWRQTFCNWCCIKPRISVYHISVWHGWRCGHERSRRWHMTNPLIMLRSLMIIILIPWSLPEKMSLKSFLGLKPICSIQDVTEISKVVSDESTDHVIVQILCFQLLDPFHWGYIVNQNNQHSLRSW